MRMSAARWAELVAAWEASGLSAGSFSTEHGVSESSLRWWKTELVRRARKQAARRSPGPGRRPRATVPMARVLRQGDEIPRSAPPRTHVAIVIGGMQIVVERGFDRQLLRDVVGALREAT